MKPLSALLFDVDGTLADTERDGHRVAFNQAFSEAGLDWEWSVPLYGELLEVTGGKERIRRYIEQYVPTMLENDDLDSLIVQLHQQKTKHYLKLLSSGTIPLRPGVERLLKEARQAGLTLGIATTTTPENVTWLIKSTLGESAIEWFSVIAAGDIVPAKKPAADIYQYALNELGLDPEECIAFEDSYNGICSSLGAGLRTVITANDYTRDHDFTGADLVLDHFGEPDAPCAVRYGTLYGAHYLSIDTLINLSKP